MVFWRELKLKAVAFKKGQQQPSVAVSNACFIIMNKLVGWFLGGGGYHRFPVPCQSNWVKKQSFLYRVDYLFLLFFATRYLPFFFSKSVHQKLPIGCNNNIRTDFFFNKWWFHLYSNKKCILLQTNEKTLFWLDVWA